MSPKKTLILGIFKRISGRLGTTKDLLELKIINGTHWLHLGGNVERFEAVIGEPPATSSEVTLVQALEEINKTSTGRQKAMISFEPKNFASDYLSILETFSKVTISSLVSSMSNLKSFQNFPIWINYNEFFREDSSLMSIIELPNKPYGLDQVFDRVQTEGILLPHDYHRLKSILTEAFDNHQVDTNQKIYLQRKYKNIKKDHANSFTELYMNNLLHLVDHIEAMDNPEFLPDLQRTDTSCSKSDLGKVKIQTYLDSFSNILNVSDGIMTSKCSLLKIRAGIFLKPDCLSSLTNFLYDNTNVRLLVYAYPHDSFPVKDLVTSLNVLGQNNVLLDIPKVITKKIQALSGSTAFEDVSSSPTENYVNSALSLNMLNVSHLVVSLLALKWLMF